MTTESQAPPASAPKPCPASNQRGEPCRSPFIGESGWCSAHDPELAAERAAWRVRGGQGTSKVARLERALTSSPTVSTLIELVAQTSIDVRRGEVSPQVANSVFTGAKTLLATMVTATEQERLMRLEALIERIGQGGGEVVVEPLRAVE